jgi:predicted dehydrogenase
MTVLGIWSPTPDHPSVQEAFLAPWLEAASVVVTRDLKSADAILAIFASVPEESDVAVLREQAGQRPVLITGSATNDLASRAIPELTGVRIGSRSPASHEVRVRRAAAVDPRAEGDLLVHTAWPLVDKVADDVEVLATANVAFSDHPVLTWRASTGIGLMSLSSDDVWSQRDMLRTVQRWARHVRGISEASTVRVGLLAYGAIGHEHLSACVAVPGLELAAVCDRSQARLDAALVDAPNVMTTTEGTELLSSPDIDLVIISTPPDTHAMWALRALEAGKNVVMEKPMALTSAECDAVLDIARTVGKTALVYQNRRWDSDFLTLKRAVDAGRIGDMFHLETFVGGFGHPCNYWHSDASVSGGAIFDWGSHFIDQIMQLNGSPVTSVTATNYKRRWLDVTNADHSVVNVSFENGVNAEFIHSDLAAVLKPKYYVLGTDGAIVGNWRHERLLSRTGIGTMAEELFAPADAPADLTLVNSDGDRTLLAPVQPREHGFHRELADQLVAGLPLSVRPEQSRDVVAVMEAAELSASSGSAPVTPL